MANTAWAVATGAPKHAALFAVLAKAAEQRLSDFGALDLPNIAWAFALAAQWDVALFMALARAAERRLGEFSL